MVFVSLFSGFPPISELGEMTSIGTLFAFVIVCIGIIVMRKNQSQRPAALRTPWCLWCRFWVSLVCFAMMYFARFGNLDAAVRLAGHRAR